jgi:predicted tellurium resistance membrane protein TerC
MAEFFSISNLFTLLMLIMLQAVLGFDNLLYISLESKKVEETKRKRVRLIGISFAILLRIALLFVLVSLIDLFQGVLFQINLGDFMKSKFNGHSLIVLFGGGFIIYTAMKEIWHMISHESLDEEKGPKKTKSANAAITMIVIMNIIFSFDSILSAIALTNGIGSETAAMTLMSIAIVVSGILMIIMSNKVSEFLQKNRMFEVLGLFVLFIVGIMLLTEGGHLAHMEFLGNKITPMSKTTFYFVLVVLVIVDIVQSKYQKKIIKIEQSQEEKTKEKNKSTFAN